MLNRERDDERVTDLRQRGNDESRNAMIASPGAPSRSAGKNPRHELLKELVKGNASRTGTRLLHAESFRSGRPFQAY